MKFTPLILILLLAACANTRVEIRTIRPDEASAMNIVSPTYVPTPSPDPTLKVVVDTTRLGSRTNPVQPGETVHVLVSGHSVEFTLNQVYQAEAAQQFIGLDNAPPAGMEYLLVYITVNYPAANTSSVVIHGNQFGVISNGEVLRGDPTQNGPMIGPKPPLYFELTPGTTTSGWLVVAVHQRDRLPLLVWNLVENTSIDDPSLVYFSVSSPTTISSLPTVTASPTATNTVSFVPADTVTAMPTETLPATAVPATPIPGDLAWNRPAYASSYWEANYPSNVTKGGNWESAGSTGTWWFVDLGSPRTFQQIIDTQYVDQNMTQAPQNYYIVSNDLITWRVIIEEINPDNTAGRGKPRIHTLSAPITARYVGLYAADWGGGWGDMQVFAVLPKVAMVQTTAPTSIPVVPMQTVVLSVPNPLCTQMPNC